MVFTVLNVLLYPVEMTAKIQNESRAVVSCEE